MLADEPIAEVDTENADLILAALWDVIGRGGAVLAATHNPEALRYANRVVLFRDGVVEGRLSPTSSPGSSRRTSLASDYWSGSSEPEGLPDVVASIHDGVGIELDRQLPLSGLAPQHAVEHRAPTAGSRQRRGHAIAPRLTDAALQVEVSGGVPDRGSTDVHGQSFPGTSVRRSTSGSASASGSGAACAETSRNERRTSRFQSRLTEDRTTPSASSRNAQNDRSSIEPRRRCGPRSPRHRPSAPESYWSLQNQCGWSNVSLAPSMFRAAVSPS